MRRRRILPAATALALLALAACGGLVVPDSGNDSGRDWHAILHPQTAGYDDERESE
jgi:hypothetical protein